MTEADREWFHALEFWYESGLLDQVEALLRDNVPLSAANAAFLADVLSGVITRPRAKQEPIYLAKQRVIDEEIRRLDRAGFDDEAIRHHLVQQELVHSRLLVKRVVERRKSPPSSEGPISNFASVYESRTGIKLY